MRSRKDVEATLHAVSEAQPTSYDKGEETTASRKVASSGPFQTAKLVFARQVHN